MPKKVDEVRMHKRQRAVAAARACLGTPFAHQGRLATTGLDCVGLIMVAASAVGLKVPEIADYGRQPDLARLPMELTAAGLSAVPLSSKTIGDVLLFTVGRHPRHVGLLSDFGMVHAWAQTGRVVEHRLDRSWLDRLVAVYRFPGC